jgi:hypothetical protein
MKHAHQRPVLALLALKSTLALDRTRTAREFDAGVSFDLLKDGLAIDPYDRKKRLVWRISCSL